LILLRTVMLTVMLPACRVCVERRTSRRHKEPHTCAVHDCKHNVVGLRSKVGWRWIGWRWIGWRWIGWRWIGWRWIGWRWIGWRWIG
jgi:hypothetical protein